ncbi:uncharacterized protein LOC121786711 [Salvia splendens]|uniref:uncharacterized protein LOC121786711 n=1 Tax=Salvia splendens TaxID=180675 RepID=UPI001C25998D|nr:uncharacterized protein LOC121786711 [Salvia splendens]
MRVFKWAPDFDTFFESPIVAVWCKLIGIPIHLYEQSALLAIGKLLGKPIQADHATINQNRLTFARICLEIDISQPPSEEIILNILGKDTRYKVVWDRIPTYCIECKHVGHVQEECLIYGKTNPPKKDHGSHATTPRRHNSRRTYTRREWRPKGPKADDPTHQPDHSTASKEEPKQGPPEESKAADTSPSLKVTRVNQVQVDEDGFQLITRWKKGKMNYSLHHYQEGPLKAPYLEKLLTGGNVATVSFGDTDMGVIDPGGSSTVCIG